MSEIFNDFFINVAKNIGNKSIVIDKNHDSVCMIEKHKSFFEDLSFKPVTTDFVSKQKTRSI